MGVKLNPFSRSARLERRVRAMLPRGLSPRERDENNTALSSFFNVLESVRNSYNYHDASYEYVSETLVELLSSDVPLEDALILSTHLVKKLHGYPNDYYPYSNFQFTKEDLEGYRLLGITKGQEIIDFVDSTGVSGRNVLEYARADITTRSDIEFLAKHDITACQAVRYFDNGVKIHRHMAALKAVKIDAVKMVHGRNDKLYSNVVEFQRAGFPEPDDMITFAYNGVVSGFALASKRLNFDTMQDIIELKETLHGIYAHPYSDVVPALIAINQTGFRENRDAVSSVLKKALSGTEILTYVEAGFGNDYAAILALNEGGISGSAARQLVEIWPGFAGSMEALIQLKNVPQEFIKARVLTMVNGVKPESPMQLATAIRESYVPTPTGG